MRSGIVVAVAVVVAAVFLPPETERFEAAGIEDDIQALAQRMGELRAAQSGEGTADGADEDYDGPELFDPKYGPLAYGLMRNAPRVFRRLVAHYDSPRAFDVAALERELVPFCGPGGGRPGPQSVSPEKGSSGSTGPAGPAGPAGPGNGAPVSQAGERSPHVSTSAAPATTSTSYPFASNAPATYAAHASTR